MKEPDSECYVYATNYIYRYPKTEKELKGKLYQKGFREHQVEDTVAFLKFKGFLDDRLFTEMYLNSEVIKKGKPLLSVKQKLFYKGVDKHLIQEVIDTVEDDILDGMKTKIRKDFETYKKKGKDWFDAIQRLIRKWYKLEDIKSAILEEK